MAVDFASYLASAQTRAERAIDQLLPAVNEPASRLKEAMRYSVLNGGKRVRASLIYAAYQAVSGRDDHQGLDHLAIAMELVHAYSLVHDDLPAMDDDDLRRGLPTCHKAFDEATAILAGDALQTEAFALLTQAPDLSAEQKLACVFCLAQASGIHGMVAGQAVDLASENKQISLAELELLHRHKTGALIEASVKLGAIAANATAQQVASLATYAQAIGLAFQVQDDILDVEGDTTELGKHTGADALHQKSTYPSLLGLDRAKQLASELEQQAITALHDFGPAADPLRALATFIVTRRK